MCFRQAKPYGDIKKEIQQKEKRKKTNTVTNIQRNSERAENSTIIIKEPKAKHITKLTNSSRAQEEITGRRDLTLRSIQMLLPFRGK